MNRTLATSNALLFCLLRSHELFVVFEWKFSRENSSIFFSFSGSIALMKSRAGSVTDISLVCQMWLNVYNGAYSVRVGVLFNFRYFHKIRKTRNNHKMGKKNKCNFWGHENNIESPNNCKFTDEHNSFSTVPTALWSEQFFLFIWKVKRSIAKHRMLYSRVDSPQTTDTHSRRYSRHMRHLRRSDSLSTIHAQNRWSMYGYGAVRMSEWVARAVRLCFLLKGKWAVAAVRMRCDTGPIRGGDGARDLQRATFGECEMPQAQKIYMHIYSFDILLVGV